MLIIRSIFLYLDRTYVISTSGVRSLFEMGLQLFGGHLAQHPEVGMTCLAFHCNMTMTYRVSQSLSLYGWLSEACVDLGYTPIVYISHLSCPT